jgi:hypothetical protein
MTPNDETMMMPHNGDTKLTAMQKQQQELSINTIKHHNVDTMPTLDIRVAMPQKMLL